ncbi:chorismate synthase [Vallitalea pronyensis]|uniref:Chorismate synthase n=1 Tax=Vallitalea pronyensis TaxID=1348613 RepID=A0A8J8SHS5_9FIRM|nr:chorismate synthase [Vallitalea pronyensis]QUI23727.1 chorismate synthase [Vallitalea pronyensis]
MAGSSFGTLFKLSTWGESHGKAVGVVIDGCPAGIPLTTEDIQQDLDKRKPGQSAFATPRKEADQVDILSGVFEGKTTGTPLSLLVYNQNQRSKDYTKIADYYRPGHADLTYDLKYGFRDYRGGGRSSGRETIGRVAAGAVAKKILKALGISITTYTKSIGKIHIDLDRFNKEQIWQNPLCMPDSHAVEAAATYVKSLMKAGNSCGGIIESYVEHLPAGLGEPVFDRLDAELAKAIMSIGSVKGFEIGNGFEASSLTGLENNDFYGYKQGLIVKESNHAGGIYGGISDGSKLVLRAAIKPTPSIHATQKTINQSGEEINISIQGRHDPIIVPRAVIVVESMVAVTIVDMLLRNMGSQISHIKKIYTKQ